MQALQRLNRPIFADGPCDTLDQLVSVGLRPVCLTLYLLVRSSNPYDFFTHCHTPLLRFAESYNDLRESLYHPAFQGAKIP